MWHSPGSTGARCHSDPHLRPNPLLPGGEAGLLTERHLWQVKGIAAGVGQMHNGTMGLSQIVSRVRYQLLTHLHTLHLYVGVVSGRGLPESSAAQCGCNEWHHLLRGESIQNMRPFTVGAREWWLSRSSLESMASLVQMWVIHEHCFCPSKKRSGAVKRSLLITMRRI